MTNINLNDVPPDEDLFGLNKKKKKNGNKKGKSYERLVGHRLTELMGDVFKRSPGSGAFMGGMNWIRNQGINDAANEVLVSDLITPKYFGFVCELKNYYDSPKVPGLLEGSDTHLDKWIKQASGDATKVNKAFLLLFKITVYRKSYACLNLSDFAEYCSNRKLPMPDSYLIYQHQYIIIDQEIFFESYLKHLKVAEDKFYINK